MKTEKAGLYVHFPFCRRKCPYCHFASAPKGPGDFDKWRQGLEREADRYADRGLEFDTLYIGGGTPSLLEPADLRGLLDVLKARFSLRLGEFTLEANPSSFKQVGENMLRTSDEPRACPSSFQQGEDFILRTSSEPRACPSSFKYVEDSSLRMKDEPRARPSFFENVEGGNLRMKDEPRACPSHQETKAHPTASEDEQTLAGWAEAGVTRLSVGVQSFDDDVLDILGRESSEAQAADFVRLARRAGFASVGLDLMVGVPGETRCGLIKTLAGVRRSAPDHVSLYILENVEGLPFEAVLRGNPVEDDAAADAFGFMAAGLEAEGLRRYEISNFARPGHECLHNLKYWRYEPFLGLGPSAGSHIGNERWMNAPRLDDWATALDEGRDPRAEIVSLGPDDLVKEALVAGLRLARGIDALEFKERFGTDLFSRYKNEMAELVRDGFLVREGPSLRIPADRLLVSNAILARLV